MVAAVFVVTATVGAFSTGTDKASTGPAAEQTQGPMSPREVSDAFWSDVAHFGPTNYQYRSLEEMTADADLVVRGHLIGVTVESIQSFAQNPLHESLTAPFGVVAIEEVLKGRPESKVPGEILVARLGIPGMEAAALPQEPLILFLKNYAQMRVDLGVEPASDADDRYHYAQPNGYQCVLRDFGNLVALLPGPDGWEESSLGPFPSDLAGKPFDDIVATVAQEVDAVSSAE